MKRVTMLEIARVAGVSVMTVSLALRDQGRVSKEVRENIKRCAEKLGYRPDPALSALMVYRREQKVEHDYQTMAFVTNFPDEFGWKKEVYTQLYFEGAVDRAEKLGYRVEPFWMAQPHVTPARAAQILESRGIKGLLVAPVLAAQADISLAWDRFCAVSLCRNLVSPNINVVDHNHYQSMTMSWRELRKRGYRRIGYAVSECSEEIAGRQWLAALLMEQQRGQVGEEAILPLVAGVWNRDTFNAWLKKNQPDVVISPHIAAHRWLGELGWKIPDQMGFVWLEADMVEPITGVAQHFENVGVAAVDLLHLELTRSTYGIPSIRQTIGIDGVWYEGATLCRVSTT